MRRPGIVFVGLVVCVAAAFAGEWTPAKGPLMTKWAKEVSPTNAHPEYPRPQMVRKEWLNLNGLWDYAIRPKAEGAPKQFDGKILVPFPVESALSGVMKRVGKDQRLWYRRTVTVPEAWKGKTVLLHFGAIDWEATVYIDGKHMGEHRGGYDAFSFEIPVAAGKQHEIVVGVFDPSSDGNQPRGKQVVRPGGIMYTPTTGIWQTVWLEPVKDPDYIRALHIVPDVDAGVVRVAALYPPTDRSAKPVMTSVSVVERGKVVATAKGAISAYRRFVEVKMPNARLWSPDQPFLYDLRVSLVYEGKVVDEVTSYFGMRKVSMAKDEKGFLRLMLNNKPVFHIGPLDQGFWPDGLYTAPTDAALRYDVEMTKKLGMNCARKHVKVEPARWYYWCDKLGLMVWQDMPSGNNKSPEARKQFEAELVSVLKTFWNHPSIVMWVPFNEGWGQHDTERYCQLIKKLDPSRLVNNASGWTDRKVGDVHDVHSYPGPACPKPEETRAAVLGEFGGLGLKVDGHTWEQKTWGYRSMASSEELTRRYVKLLQKVHELKIRSGLAAAIYTQTTDVETECNGLMTYDRALVKLDAEQATKANLGDFPPPPEVQVVVPTSQQQGAAWRHSTQKPGGGWEKPGFDDTAWKESPGGFGTRATPGAVVRTEWKGASIWLRREVTLEAPKAGEWAIRMHHDEDAKVFVNGVLVLSTQGYTTDYEDFELNAKAQAAFKPGKNLIAVYCHQTGGGQYIDLGIVRLIPAEKPKR